MSIGPSDPLRAAASAAGFRISAQLRRLMGCVRQGEMFIGSTTRRRERLSAEFVRWLCANREIAQYVHAHGLNISKVEITGALDLDSVSCAFPVSLKSCLLPETCTVRFAEFPFLRFLDCELEEVLGDNIRVGGSLVFRGSLVRKGVLLRGANIGGNLNFHSSRLGTSGENSINIEGATIEGSLWMVKGFRADGPVRIYSAEIKKNIESDGLFVSPRKPAALLIENSRIGGAVLLRRGFRCLGQVRIFGTTVQGAIDLQGARIAMSRALGLMLEASSVSRSILIRGNYIAPHEPFRCVGGISLARTVTEADIDFSAAEVLARSRPAANFHGIRCAGQFMCRTSKLRGRLVLTNSTVKNDTVLTGTLVENRGETAIFAAGHQCGGNLRLDEIAVTGRVEFHNVFVGDNLLAAGARFEGEATDAVIFMSGRIRGTAEFGSATFAGRLVLDYCAIGMHLNLAGVSLTMLEARQGVVGADIILSGAKLGTRKSKLPAARLVGMRCQGSLVFGEKCICEGIVDFSRSSLGGLLANNALFRNAGGVAIDGRHAQVNGQAQFADSVIKGSVRFARITVSGSLDLSGSSVEAGKRLALDLTEARVGGTLYAAHGFQVGEGVVDLSYADVATLHDDPPHWPVARSLKIEGFTYRNIAPLGQSSRIDWLHRWQPDERGADGECSWQPFEQLMDTLRRHGREGDRKAVAIAKQRAIARCTGNRFKRWLYYLYGATIRYGYRPQRALLFAPLFIGLSVVVFFAGADTLMVPTNEPVRKQWAERHVIPDGYPSFNAIAYSVDSFVPILSLQQRDTWRPDDRATCRSGPRNCGSLLRIMLWFNLALGWIITTLAVAGFTGLIRRD